MRPLPDIRRGLLVTNSSQLRERGVVTSRPRIAAANVSRTSVLGPASAAVLGPASAAVDLAKGTITGAVNTTFNVKTPVVKYANAAYRAAGKELAEIGGIVAEYEQRSAFVDAAAAGLVDLGGSNGGLVGGGGSGGLAVVGGAPGVPVLVSPASAAAQQLTDSRRVLGACVALGAACGLLFARFAGRKYSAAAGGVSPLLSTVVRSYLVNGFMGAFIGAYASTLSNRLGRTVRLFGVIVAVVVGRMVITDRAAPHTPPPQIPRRSPADPRDPAVLVGTPARAVCPLTRPRRACPRVRRSTTWPSRGGRRASSTRRARCSSSSTRSCRGLMAS